VLVALPSASPVLVLGLPSRRIGAIALAASGLRKSVTMFYKRLPIGTPDGWQPVVRAPSARGRVRVRLVGTGGGGLKRDGRLASATAGTRAVLEVSRPQNLEVAERCTADPLV